MKIKLIAIALCTLFVTCLHAQSGNKIILRGYLENPKMVDSIRLLVWDRLYSTRNHYLLPHREIKLKLNSPTGYFEFIVDSIKGPVYFSIGQELEHFGHLDRPVLDLYIAEPGDSVTIINLGRRFASFYGRGAAKYQCRYTLDTRTLFNFPSVNYDSTGQLTILNEYKQQLSPFIYGVLKAEIVGRYLQAHITSLSRMLDRKELPAGWRRQLMEAKNISNWNTEIPIEAKSFSHYYLTMLMQKALVDAKSANNQGMAFDLLKNSYPTPLRDKLLTAYFIDRSERIANADSLLSAALAVVKSKDDRSELLSLQDRLSIGKPGYDFSLSDEHGKTVRLSDFKGKTVLIDFWFTGCKACMLYFENVLTPVEERLVENKDVVFVTINIDQSRELWLNTLRKGGYTSPRAVNLYTDGLMATHPVITHYKVSGYPRPLLIDKRGNIFTTDVLKLRVDKEMLYQEILKAMAL